MEIDWKTMPSGSSVSLAFRDAGKIGDAEKELEMYD